MVEVVDRPQSQQVLSTRWVSKQRLDGSCKVRLVARGFETQIQISMQERQSSRLCAHFFPLQQFTEIQLLSEIVTVHFVNHRCQLNQSRCTWNQHLKHSWTLPRYMNYSQLTSDPSTHVKKRAQRPDGSILLRHMDDVVGTGPEEHLMCDLEHMSLYLTDVVVLRHEGDTVNFSGLEITKTRKGWKVKNSADLVESLLFLYGLQN